MYNLFNSTFSLTDENLIGSIAPSVNYHQPMFHGDNGKDSENIKKNNGVSSVSENSKSPNIQKNDASSSKVTNNIESNTNNAPPAPPPPPPPPPSEAPPSIPEGSV